MPRSEYVPRQQTKPYLQRLFADSMLLTMPAARPAPGAGGGGWQPARVLWSLLRVYARDVWRPASSTLKTGSLRSLCGTRTALGVAAAAAAAASDICGSRQMLETECDFAASSAWLLCWPAAVALGLFIHTNRCLCASWTSTSLAKPDDSRAVQHLYIGLPA